MDCLVVCVVVVKFENADMHNLKQKNERRVIVVIVIVPGGKQSQILLCRLRTITHEDSVNFCLLQMLSKQGRDK